MLFIGTLIWAAVVVLLITFHAALMAVAAFILGQRLGHVNVGRRHINQPITGVFDLAWKHRDEFGIAGLMRLWRIVDIILLVVVVVEAVVMVPVALLGIFLDLFAR